MSEQKPEAVWVFPEPTKKSGPRIALIVLLVVLALIVAGVVGLFLIPRGGDGPAPSTSPTSATTASSGPSISPTPAGTTSNGPTAGPTTAPPPEDPSVPVFREQIGFRLTTAQQGLDIIAQGGSDAAATVSKLQGDAQRLSDAPAPAAIATDWRAALLTYSDRLDALGRNAADVQALDDARAALSTMTSLVGG